MVDTGLHPSVPIDYVILIGSVDRMLDCSVMALDHSVQVWAAMMDDPYGQDGLSVAPGPFSCYAVLGNPTNLTFTVDRNPNYSFCFLKGHVDSTSFGGLDNNLNSCVNLF